MSGQLASNQGAVAVDLRFIRDEEGRRVISGTLDTTVKVACQRCLQDMDLDLHSEMSLFAVDDEEAFQELRDDQDGVIVPDDGMLDVQALVEDELLLSLPMIPMHEDPACNAALNALREGEAVIENRPNPFAVLAGFKAGQANGQTNERNAGSSGTDTGPDGKHEGTDETDGRGGKPGRKK
ncbi:MAG: YceD family protein [Pseudomonadota bacterium]|nr:YceD family protein [Pseudomonadota bacterium]